MNFFEVLKYYSNLSENFTSSFVKFLLIPSEKHGLNYFMLRSVLDLIESDIRFHHVINKKDKLIIPEHEKNLGKSYGRIEISIEFSYRDPKTNHAKNAIILIENKIHDYSIKNEDKGGKKQIVRYLDYLAKKSNADYKKLIYLLPETTDLQDFSEYYLDEIESHPLKSALSFLYWKHPEDIEACELYQNYFLQGKSFITVFEKIIQDEAQSFIAPLDPNLLYLIKSFIHTVNNNFAFDEYDDALIQKYSDFKDNLYAVDRTLHQKLVDFEGFVKRKIGKPLNDSMATRSVKIGIPVPRPYYRNNYSNPQFLLLLKELGTVEGSNYFPIVFEGYYYGKPHWDLLKLESYLKRKRLKYHLNKNDETIKVFILTDTILDDVLDFEQLKDFRLDKSSSS